MWDKNVRDKGSALLISVVLIMVLLMIFVAMISVVNYSRSFETSEEKGIRAYYLAEAGTNYGIAIAEKEVEASLNKDKYKEFIKNDPDGKYTMIAKKPPALLGNDYPGEISIDEIEITMNEEDVQKIEEPTILENGELGEPVVDVLSAKYEITVTSTGYYPDKSGIKRTLQKSYRSEWRDQGLLPPAE